MILFMLLGTGPIAMILMLPPAIIGWFDKRAHRDFEPRIFERQRQNEDGSVTWREYKLEQRPEWAITCILRQAVHALLFI